MIRDFSNVRPAEAAALFRLKYIVPSDIEAIATGWLEQGLDGENIASLAFPHSDSFDGISELFEKAFIEAGLPRQLSKKECLWIAVRFYLKRIINSPQNAKNILSSIIDIELDFGEPELFLRPDCDAYFEEHKEEHKFGQKKFAAQGLGIEQLFGAYYSEDDWYYDEVSQKMSHEEWLAKEHEKNRVYIVKESQRVLDKFYSADSDLPDDLTEAPKLCEI